MFVKLLINLSLTFPLVGTFKQSAQLMSLFTLLRCVSAQTCNCTECSHVLLRVIVYVTSVLLLGAVTFLSIFLVLGERSEKLPIRHLSFYCRPIVSFVVFCDI